MRKEIPSEIHVQKFNEMSSPRSGFGTFEWDVLLFNEMPTFQTLQGVIFWCGKVNNRLGKTLWTAKMISLHIFGVNSYWFWQTAMKQCGVVVFERRLPKWTNLCNTCDHDFGLLTTRCLLIIPGMVLLPNTETCDCGWIFPDTYTPENTHGYGDYGLEQVTPFKYTPILVSMLNFWGVYFDNLFFM